MRATLNPGTQIAYIPSHVRQEYQSRVTGDLVPGWSTAPGVEFGFVVEPRITGALCRFFHENSVELRTLANSEFARWEDLVECDHLPQGTINTLLRGCQNSPEKDSAAP